MDTLSRVLAIPVFLALAGSARAQANPPNDDCGQAIHIGDGTVAGTTTNATISTNGCGLSGLTPDVWYSYTAQHTGLLALDTCGSSYDTSITLYSSCGLTVLALTCNDDAGPGSPCGYQTWQSYLTHPVVAGQTLKIRISGFIGATGPFVLTTSNRTGQPFCLGDGTSASICPCSNTVPNSPASGCRNSTGSGARLEAGGLPQVSGDTVELRAWGLPATTSLLFFQGSTKQANGYGAAFGDGLRCLSGSIVRLGHRVSSGGTASYPMQGEARISAKGQVPPAGGSRYYQAWYRNPAAFCTSATYNLSNGLEIAWLP